MATNHEIDTLITSSNAKTHVIATSSDSPLVKAQVPSKTLSKTPQQQKLTNGIRTRKHFHSSISDKIPARLVLYFLSWSGFLVSFMMRNDINFALVAMTRANTATDVVNGCLVALNDDNSTNNVMDITAVVNMNTIATTTPAAMLFPIDNVTSKATTIRNNIPDFKNINDTLNYNDNNADDGDVFNWSSTVRSVIISSFYWCYVLSQVVGGIATQYFGTKFVFGWSQFATAACSLCIPFCADIHYAAVIVLRSIQGFASGLTWPAMYAIVGPWIPLVERSRFMSSFQGFSIGIGLTYPLCGFLIDNFGWRYIFYTTGFFGIVWSCIWYLLAFNTPHEHPRITSTELAYIEQNISAEVIASQRMRVPWRSIFHSSVAWAIGITTFGRIWIHYIFIIGGPSFMKNILKFDYEANGFLSGMPFVCSYISSVIFCYIADQLTLRHWLSLTNVRKVFTALSQIVPGLLIYWIGYIETNIIQLLVIWFIAVTFITASYAGAMATIVDIAPNLAGPVLAFCQTIHMSASFLSPLVIGLLVTNECSIEQWRTVFTVSTIITIATYMVYQFCGTSDIQKWNYPAADAAAIHNNVTNHVTMTTAASSPLSNARCEMAAETLKNAGADNSAVNSIASSTDDVEKQC